MAIEVKQMIIKSTLVHGHRDDDGPKDADVDIELLKEEVMEECRALIEQSLNEMQER